MVTNTVYGTFIRKTFKVLYTSSSGFMIIHIIMTFLQDIILLSTYYAFKFQMHQEDIRILFFKTLSNLFTNDLILFYLISKAMATQNQATLNIANTMAFVGAMSSYLLYNNIDGISDRLFLKWIVSAMLYLIQGLSIMFYRKSKARELNLNVFRQLGADTNFLKAYTNRRNLLALIRIISIQNTLQLFFLVAFQLGSNLIYFGMIRIMLSYLIILCANPNFFFECRKIRILTIIAATIKLGIHIIELILVWTYPIIGKIDLRDSIDIHIVKDTGIYSCFFIYYLIMDYRGFKYYKSKKYRRTHGSIRLE